MTKRFLIANIILLAALEIIKVMAVPIDNAKLFDNAIYLTFLFYMTFSIGRRFVNNISITILLASIVSISTLYAMFFPGVGLAVWLSGFIISVCSDRKEAKK